MSLKIGNAFTITKGPDVQFTAQTYMGGSIGIRGRIRSGENLRLAEEMMYNLREGSTNEIQIQTEVGQVMSGSYKINELNWKKERLESGDYDLVFNIGLQKISI